MPRFMPEGALNNMSFDKMAVEDATGDLAEALKQMYAIKNANWTPELKDNVERQITLRCIDRNWTKHIDDMSALRNSIYLRSYAHTNPLQAYNNEGYQMFSDMLDMAAIETILNLLNVVVRVNPKTEPEENVNKENAVDAEEVKPEENKQNPVIEAKNKEDKSLLDDGTEPTVTAKEH